MGARWETSDLNAWVWLSFGFQNSFPLLASKIHFLSWPLIRTRTVFSALICAITCYCSTSQNLAEPKFPLSLTQLLLITVPALLWSSLSANQQVSLFCFFFLVVFPVWLCMLKVECLTLVTSKTLWWPASVSSNFSFLISNVGEELALLYRCEMSSTKDR